MLYRTEPSRTKYDAGLPVRHRTGPYRIVQNHVKPNQKRFSQICTEPYRAVQVLTKLHRAVQNREKFGGKYVADDEATCLPLEEIRHQRGSDMFPPGGNTSQKRGHTIEDRTNRAVVTLNNSRSF